MKLYNLKVTQTREDMIATILWKRKNKARFKKYKLSKYSDNTDFWKDINDFIAKLKSKGFVEGF